MKIHHFITVLLATTYEEVLATRSSQTSWQAISDDKRVQHAKYLLSHHASFVRKTDGSPSTAWFLTPQERLIALERIRHNKTGTATTHFKWNQVYQAFTDPRIYLAAISVLCASIPNGGISSFGATIIAGFGFGTKETTLLGMSTGVSETVAMIAAVLLSRKLKMRALPAIICISVAIIGAILMVGTHNKNAQFTGYCLVFWWATGQMMFIPLMQSMVAGHTKRSMFYALYQIGYSAGNVIGAQIYRAKDAPSYIPAKITILVTITLHAATLGAIALLHKYWNNRNAKRTDHIVEEQNIEFKDRTDKEIPSFIYPY
ncbi:uncharacterized protein I206_103704 [Kwoniella pini CBS 10737]|uniref:Major facilitator superfamily (MFS) profile domain-containing protein n=1 Tax=Kwoniella pini CBS 10737 TaxID=1296096 RepID=A0AAJ8L5L4_9TREE